MAINDNTKLVDFNRYSSPEEYTEMERENKNEMKSNKKLLLLLLSFVLLLLFIQQKIKPEQTMETETDLAWYVISYYGMQ